MSESVDILIVGGGISGVSLAARLAPHAQVGLVEAEEHLGTQATGRSAALLVEAYEMPEIRRLTKASRAFFESPPEDFSAAPLARPRGVVIYGRQEERARLRGEFDLARQTASVEWLEGGTAVNELCPLLRPGVAAAGFIEPGALALDADALLQGFARVARGHGARIWTSAPVSRIARAAGGWLAEAGAHRISCRVLVDAAGAWADAIAGLAGVVGCGLQPRRRTAATVGVPQRLASLLPTHPFVAPVDGSFYFKPEAGAVMVSLAEEAPSEPCNAFADDGDVALALDRFYEATVVPPIRPTTTWAGLRTFAPDRLPVLGFDPQAEGFFWYAGQGGAGIQTSPAHSLLAARLLLGEVLDKDESALADAFRAGRLHRRI